MLSLLILVVILSIVGAVPSRRSFYQNGLDAQALNAQYSKMNAQDGCQASATACVQGGFAQCIAGFWKISACPQSLICVALPEPASQNGTSVACTTEIDALSRIASTGAPGGLTGGNMTILVTSASALLTPFTSPTISSATPITSTQPSSATEPISLFTSMASISVISYSPTPTQSASSNILANGVAAQKANQVYQTLNLKDYCNTTGLTGCIASILAKCNNGYWSLGNSCTAPNTECFAVPVTSGNGTTVGCYARAEAAQLIAATGATGGVYGAESTKNPSSGGCIVSVSLTAIVIMSLLPYILV